MAAHTSLASRDARGRCRVLEGRRVSHIHYLEIHKIHTDRYMMQPPKLRAHLTLVRPPTDAAPRVPHTGICASGVLPPVLRLSQTIRSLAVHHRPL